MTREQEALINYADQNRLARGDIAEVFDYSKAAVSAWFKGKCHIPPVVLLTIGFYAPVYQPEIDEVNRYRFKVADIAAAKKRIAEDRELRKLNSTAPGTYRNKAERNADMKLIRRWCEMHGFIGKRGGCDISRAAAYLNRSYSTASNYIYGENKPPKEIISLMRKELGE